MKRTLKGIRADLNMTQEEMAKMLGITKLSYLKKENGERPLLASELIKISEMAKVSANDIVIPL